MIVLRDINQLLALVHAPQPAARNDFGACALENRFSKEYIQPAGVIRTLFYIIAIISNDSFEFSVNNSARMVTRSHTLFFASPFHLFHFKQISGARGQCIYFTEPFIHPVYQSSDFHRDFPFLWSNQPFFFIQPESASILLQLGKKIIEEAEMTGPFSDNIIRDYLHIFLLESKRIILPAGVIEDNTSDYYLLQQFYKLIKSTYPIIKSVDAAAGALSVTPARLWLVVKKLTGESPSEIINHRVLTEAQSLLLHSSLTISEIGFYLGFKEKSHFTRFFKNLTAIPPIDYVRQHKAKSQ